MRLLVSLFQRTALRQHRRQGVLGVSHFSSSGVAGVEGAHCCSPWAHLPLQQQQQQQQYKHGTFHNLYPPPLFSDHNNDYSYLLNGGARNVIPAKRGLPLQERMLSITKRLYATSSGATTTNTAATKSVGDKAEEWVLPELDFDDSDDEEEEDKVAQAAPPQQGCPAEMDWHELDLPEDELDDNEEAEHDGENDNDNDDMIAAAALQKSKENAQNDEILAAMEQSKKMYSESRRDNYYYEINSSGNLLSPTSIWHTDHPDNSETQKGNGTNNNKNKTALSTPATSLGSDTIGSKDF